MCQLNLAGLPWAALVLAFLSLIAPQADAESSSRGLQVPARVEIGFVNENENRPFTCSISNNSQQEIRILSIETSCACTNAEVEGAPTLGPGESRTVKGEIHFGYLPGGYEALVYIHWQGGGAAAKSESKIRIAGEVRSPLVLTARHIDLGSAGIDGAERVASLDAKKGNAPFAWDEIVPSGSLENLRVHIREAGKNNLEISVALDPKGLPMGQNRLIAKLQFKENGVLLPGSIEIPVLVRINGPISANPPSLFFGLIRKEGASKSVAIRSTGVDLQGVEVTSDDPRLRIEAGGPSATELGLSISIAGDQSDRAKAVASRISVKTKNGLVLNIPVMGFYAENEPANPKP